MKKNLLFALVVILLLAPWPVAYAYDNDMVGEGPVQIEAAEASAAPSLKVFGNAIGGVTPGDLFYIDTANTSIDIPVTLYLTNTDELIRHYRYLNLKVEVYVQTGTDQWEKITEYNGELIPDTYITMRNGYVSFTLPGCARYKVAIDSGCFYAYRATTDGASYSPKFYLAAEL